ncbi:MULTISPECIES: DUF3558 domain-containing protein [Mycobacteriaceae]|jgi:hypothetical protein|uniref:DUF3558 domain-containing protein n=3 Tax=Mycobacteriaceae TaxID=1762 RepID=A0A1Y0C6S2_9MYCO|nr:MULTISPECIES: DUF3558 domain-containing protein [Mycobacteriaceae]ART70930.1 DUF3558 domain-containing protein [Mycobacterium dioxanotrophicus]MCV7157780.1 DUF3558 domain-containing protein [Mycolicibacterium brisbanense]OBC11794.1 DUF3558 domain-containing protein [Mycobacterium sp. 852013-50091_SCH5140682]ORA22598.1 DUF3558 domain-containing protein [Mycobacterium aquaticum]GAS87984.1 membrane protein [Mycolicibacterium brisbanense]
MAARVRLLSALCALVAAVVVVLQTGTSAGSGTGTPQLNVTDLPMTNVSTTIKWPVIATTDPSPFDPCNDIPLDVIQRIGLAYTPPAPEDSLRCHYDAGDYQMAVEAFVWRTYEQTIPPDAVELDIDGHRAAQYWIMKPTDWNDRWWVTCMVAFKTSYGLIQQSLFYSPIKSPDRPDCLQVNMQRAHELAPYYKF